jgi:hypothetical protein
MELSDPGWFDAGGMVTSMSGHVSPFLFGVSCFDSAA